MATIEKSVEVRAPLHAVYEQWTRFENFPQFMSGVQEVRQLDDTHLFWRAKVGPQVLEWEALITEQVPDRRLAWRSTRGRYNAGTVDFHSVSPDRTRVTVRLEYEPEDLVERIGKAMGFPSHRVEEDLLRFKLYIERLGEKKGPAREPQRGRRASRQHPLPIPSGSFRQDVEEARGQSRGLGTARPGRSRLRS